MEFTDQIVANLQGWVVFEVGDPVPDWVIVLDQDDRPRTDLRFRSPACAPLHSTSCIYVCAHTIRAAFTVRTGDRVGKVLAVARPWSTYPAFPDAS